MKECRKLEWDLNSHPSESRRAYLLSHRTEDRQKISYVSTPHGHVQETTTPDGKAQEACKYAFCCVSYCTDGEVCL